MRVHPAALVVVPPVKGYRVVRYYVVNPDGHGVADFGDRFAAQRYIDDVLARQLMLLRADRRRA